MKSNHNPAKDDNNSEDYQQRKRSALDWFLIIAGCPAILNLFYVVSGYIDVIVGGSVILIISNHFILSSLSAVAVYGLQKLIKFVVYWPYWIYIGLLLCEDFLKYSQGAISTSDLLIQLFHVAVLLITGFLLIMKQRNNSKQAMSNKMQ